jgi:hypothetical protein
MDDVAIIRNQANIGAPISPQEMERRAKRRFQNPRPERRGAWWTMRVWRDEFIDGKHVRKQQRVRLAAATVSEREVKKIATEHLRPLNQGLESLGSATNFEHYIETIYKPVVKPLMATTSFDRTRGVLDNYLIPALGELEKSANISCDLAENGWRRREGCAGTNAALAFEYDSGHLPAVRAGKPAACCRSTQPFSELNCDRV